MKTYIRKHIVEFMGCIFTILGIGFLVGGFILTKNLNAFMERAIAVDGVITEIVYDNVNENSSDDVFVSYEYDGQMYDHVQLNYYSSGMYEGKELTLYVDPDSPRKIETAEGNRTLLIVVFAVGGFLTIVGIPTILTSYLRKLKNNKLAETGQHIYGTIESIERDTSVTVNGRHPFRVYCNYKNPADGMTYKFKSDCLYFNPNDSYKVGDSVDVFVNPDNYKKYYVEIIDKTANTVKDYT